MGRHSDSEINSLIFFELLFFGYIHFSGYCFSICRWGGHLELEERPIREHGERKGAAADLLSAAEYGPEWRHFHRGTPVCLQEVCGTQSSVGNDISGFWGHVLWRHGRQIQSHQNNRYCSNRIRKFAQVRKEITIWIIIFFLKSSSNQLSSFLKASSN